MMSSEKSRDLGYYFCIFWTIFCSTKLKQGLRISGPPFSHVKKPRLVRDKYSNKFLEFDRICWVFSYVIIFLIICVRVNVINHVKANNKRSFHSRYTVVFLNLWRNYFKVRNLTSEKKSEKNYSYVSHINMGWKIQDLILSPIHHVYFQHVNPILFENIVFFSFSQFAKIYAQNNLYIESLVK